MYGSIHIPAFLQDSRVRWALAALVAVSLVWLLFFRGGNGEYQTLVVHRGEFIEQVSVSGTVKAAQNVDLGFAQSGRVSGVYAKVGDSVSAGTLLAQTENDDLRAAVSQKEASLASQRAKLDLLLAGTRPEEIAVKEATVQSGRVSLAQSVQAEFNALQDAYTSSDDAVRNQADQFFSNPRTTNTKLTFNVSDAQLKIRVENGRAALEGELTAWKNEVDALVTQSDLGAAEAAAQARLSRAIAFLSDVNQALNLASYDTTYTQAVISGYIADIATARSNVNAARTTLQSAVTARQDDASTLNKDEKDLALLKAGSTPQDIEAQRALVKAAEADVQSARSQLSKTVIAAPFSGIVTRMDAKVGAIVSPGDIDISMIASGAFQIESYIPEVNVARVAQGNPAKSRSTHTVPTSFSTQRSSPSIRRRPSARASRPTARYCNSRSRTRASAPE